MCRLVACLVLAGMTARAAEAQQQFDVTYCSTANVTRLYEAEGVLVWSLDGKGIAFSNHENGLLGNMTFQCVSVGRSIAGKPAGNGYCKYMDADGDLIVWEIAINGPDDTFKALHGTGKWKGIKAEGSAVVTTKAKPISPELRQVCRRFNGTLTIGKSAS